MFSEGHENIYIGLNPVMERFLYERRMRTAKTVPKGFSHVVLTVEEHNEFNCWKKLRKGKTRRRSRYFKRDKALEVWTKETTATEIDEGILSQ